MLYFSIFLYLTACNETVSYYTSQDILSFFFLLPRLSFASQAKIHSYFIFSWTTANVVSLSIVTSCKNTCEMLQLWSTTRSSRKSLWNQHSYCPCPHHSLNCPTTTFSLFLSAQTPTPGIVSQMQEEIRHLPGSGNIQCFGRIFGHNYLYCV